ncbi:16S rRNA (guanine(527)-N(7))-methyltransferase RsmG [Sphingomonas sp. SUN019]|uniref:16S rRNA (guanine(527)-N(7))-methyltransferase RsmG n=1 Tax=Sphingomonas sp. SUN019 TaxID=2937788 RepID=UPI0021642706|nr:16S rRNA (guanine(527)-N(7))-methyltransferase RsmG [Sphingomonas sp. SUN019]UVO50985.1 16S rRNA (guanine(527)-N(7))-methyltransferase RsmG [Sphingomonas sp. SUN019]
MTEDEARQWIAHSFDTSVAKRIEGFVDAVVVESTNQNLVARSTLDTIWQRHVVDSAQLLSLATDAKGRWIDIGTGAGFPGMIVSLITEAPTILIEPRRKRAEFLAAFVDRAGLAKQITISAARAEVTKSKPAATISARAVASVSEIFAMSRHLADNGTRYLLPRGRSIVDELENAKAGWHGMFHVEPSMTDPESGILVASRVRPR